MPEYCRLDAILLSYFYNFHIVGVDIDSLIRNDQLTITSFFICQNEEICVSNLELVFPVYKERKFFNSVLMELNQENSEFLIKLVAKHIEIIVFRIKNDLFDSQDIKLVI
jgi:hypothetical protein